MLAGGYDSAMRFRLGLITGFGAGYYLGAKAGQQRYEQINRTVRKVRRSDAFETVQEKAKDVVDLGVERAKDLVDAKTGSGTNGNGTTPHVDVPRTDPPIRP